MARKLTEKQTAFVREFRATRNATQAYRAAYTWQGMSDTAS